MSLPPGSRLWSKDPGSGNLAQHWEDKGRKNSCSEGNLCLPCLLSQEQYQRSVEAHSPALQSPPPPHHTASSAVVKKRSAKRSGLGGGNIIPRPETESALPKAAWLVEERICRLQPKQCTWEAEGPRMQGKVSCLGDWDWQSHTSAVPEQHTAPYSPGPTDRAQVDT